MNRLAAFAAGIVVGVTLIGGAVLVHQASDKPDITVMPCSAWADTQYPVIPDYTFTGACLNDDGTYSVANKS